jgi:Fe2+ or Zn2+ uptake regulation protein
LGEGKEDSMGENETERPGRRISGEESLVLDALNEERGPLDVITISSRTRLPIERVLEVLDYLAGQGLVERVEPEPAYERFSLQRV